MKLSTKLFGLVGIVTTAILVDRRIRRRDLAAATPVGTPARADAGIEDAEILAGAPAVDPVKLAGFGEAVDEDAVAAAHEEPLEQRERMPVRGKNIP